MKVLERDGGVLSDRPYASLRNKFDKELSRKFDQILRDLGLTPAYRTHNSKGDYWTGDMSHFDSFKSRVNSLYP